MLWEYKTISFVHCTNQTRNNCPLPSFWKGADEPVMYVLWVLTSEWFKELILSVILKWKILLIISYMNRRLYRKHSKHCSVHTVYIWYIWSYQCSQGVISTFLTYTWEYFSLDCYEVHSKNWKSWRFGLNQMIFILRWSVSSCSFFQIRAGIPDMSGPRDCNCTK